MSALQKSTFEVCAQAQVLWEAVEKNFGETRAFYEQSLVQSPGRWSWTDQWNFWSVG